MNNFKRKPVLLTVMLLAFVLSVKSETADSIESLPMPLYLVANKYAEDAFFMLTKQYNYAREDTRALRQLCRNRELEKMQLYCSPHPLNERIRIRKNIERNYADSINAMLIPYNHISGENISFALKISKKERYDSIQVKYLSMQALRLIHKKEEDSNFVEWKEEVEILKNTLTKEQFYRLFMIKNAKKTSDRLDEIWKKLKDNNVTEEIDSVKESKNALVYLSYEMAVNDIYRHDSSGRRTELSRLKRRKPLLIRLYEAIENRKQEDNTIISSQSFDW